MTSENPLADEKKTLLEANARQVLGVVASTFPEFEARITKLRTPKFACDSYDSDLDRLACQWNEAMIPEEVTPYHNEDERQASSTLEFLRSAQDLMSSTSSNYDLARLGFGQAIALMAVVLTSVLCWIATRRNHQLRGFFGLVCIAYGITMFASSYVEEEQQFWYWAVSAWLGWLYIQQ